VPRRLSDTSHARGTSVLSRNDAVRLGEWIETDGQARVALRFSNGTSVRLDSGSRVRALSSTAIELTLGAVYVDTGSETGRFEVRTALATARDVGTQFEVRVLDDTIRLRVRAGVVELKSRTRSLTTRGGTETVLSTAGVVSRPIVAHGSEWEWTARLSPPLEIEGLSLAAFLERLAREHGWSLHYADAALAKEASAIILHGSVTGLAPREAIEVAINTSGLRHHLESGELIVQRGEASR
jgi:ferric-dicitrate binding protein FerR (iron transport regulator)